MKPRDVIRRKVARRKAADIARYYHAHLNFMGTKPTLRAISKRFMYSIPWAHKYLNLARDFGFLDD